MNKHIICRRNPDSSTRVAQFKLGNMCYDNDGVVQDLKYAFC